MDKRLLEAQLIDQRERLNVQISRLVAERDALDRLILQVRAQNVGKTEVTRKNSVHRVLIENKVIEILGAAKRAVSVSKLFKEARMADSQLKYTTFRSHLHRMHLRGLIKASNTRGLWKLPEPRGDAI